MFEHIYKNANIKGAHSREAVIRFELEKSAAILSSCLELFLGSERLQISLLQHSRQT